MTLADWTEEVPECPSTDAYYDDTSDPVAGGQELAPWQLDALRARGCRGGVRSSTGYYAHVGPVGLVVVTGRTFTELLEKLDARTP